MTILDGFLTHTDPAAERARCAAIAKAYADWSARGRSAAVAAVADLIAQAIRDGETPESVKAKLGRAE